MIIDNAICIWCHWYKVLSGGEVLAWLCVWNEE